MAGTKETPRQQMINMMYIVLTAMLALQVSSSIIDKFLYLNDALEKSQDAAKVTNDSTLVALKRDVDELGTADSTGKVNKALQAGMVALKKAREIKEDARALVEGIEKIKDELIEKAGGGEDPKTGKIENPKEETRVETMMVGAEGSKSGIGYKLEDDLNKYVAMINQKVGMSLEKIAKDNSSNTDLAQKNKDFTEASFAQTPVAAALAVLTYCQSEVLRYEAEALKELGAQAQGKVIKFDKIQATYTAESNIVANGQSYEAKMFLFASASKLKTNMTVNGKSIKQVDGVGTIKIPATGGSNAGTKKTWKGKISLPEKDETFEVDGEYTVIAPTMVIQSAAVQALYEGCGNELKILVPALGSSYKPSFGG
ncbi:MAG: gliding motility protein GldM, partial [Bacteroidota bacterium]